MLHQQCPVIMPLVCLYTVVHLLFEEFKISLKSSLSTQSLCHTVSPGVGVESDFGPGVGVGVQVHVFQGWSWELESGVLNFLTPEL